MPPHRFHGDLSHQALQVSLCGLVVSANCPAPVHRVLRQAPESAVDGRERGGGVAAESPSACSAILGGLARR
jgi:hypothetical protein